ncbi:hypothetical protein [Streptomyces sp. JJ36]|uniref:hypothetical protein n=1 Tax=Streptomyces sp. JJ36 TaxID=2736645 RepID=UPI001F2CFDB0|nr:hypothetical protein [Streptomyces sp. JJ36]MCF6521652.1 hypothetical protein [Streptomyces sp. JJ36]
MLALIRRMAAATLGALLVIAVPVTANAAESDTARPAAQAAQAAVDGTALKGDLKGDQAGKRATAAPQAPDQRGTQAQATWYYHITSSCNGLESPIRQGANFWGGGVETSSSGTPVECTGGYVQGCGGGYVVGCNWGMGDRIMLSTLVNDFALLAAHEFGHNWYGHSANGCASWGSAYNVMKTTMC